MDGKAVGDDPNIKDGISQKFALLEKENKKMREEFDTQRAKMKELYLQKEGECRKLSTEIQTMKKELDEAKSQIVLAEYRTENSMQTQERKAQEEIATLQHLIQETIEESTLNKAELEKLHHEYEKLRQENLELREVVNQQDTPSLAPVLSHVKKIARKLGGDTTSQDNLEDSMRKAQEDAEVLRSLVVPLEEEIKALKEKLRATDNELQKHGQTNKKAQSQSALVGMINENLSQSTTVIEPSSNLNINISSNLVTNDTSVEKKSPMKDQKSTPTAVMPCQMCHNYEEHLIQTQNSLREERSRNVNSEKSIGRLKEELQKEAALRQDLEVQWQEKRELHKEEVQTLNKLLEKAEHELFELQKKFVDSKKELNEQMLQLTDEREQIHHHLEILQRDNDILSGKYIAHSQALQNQEINLPSTVDELQEMLLSIHENLIEAKIGCEHAESELLSLRDESQLLRAQVREQNRELTGRIEYLEELLNNQKLELQKYQSMKEVSDKKVAEFKKDAAEQREQVIELREANDKLEKLKMDLKNKMSVLQQELVNSEAVQKDFVRLSQSLQMELEKIRAADSQVRWQDDDDVDQCSACRNMFSVTRRKQHCRHCGSIYCEKCLTKTVSSGPSKRAARVCDVCHTLLVRNTAPYFSQAPPQSP